MKVINREQTITIRSFVNFFKKMDTFWKLNGYRSRTHYVLSLVAEDMNWKGPY